MVGTTTEYDVVICGAGLAGLALARQISLEAPDVSVLVLEGTADKKKRSSLNVGESTIEISAHYLADVLGLREYLEHSHLYKMGLRFFFRSGGEERFQDRPEFGISKPSAVDSFQLDRAILETDLKAFNAAMNIPMIQGAKVEDIVLGGDGGLHTVTFTQDAVNLKHTVRCSWVVDAMGRRRYLQKKLGVAEPKNPFHSAAWFRLEGRIDVCDLVPQSETAWHARVPDGRRYYSTNHLMDDGRWVWLIPLSSGCTSVGIVAHEDFFPFATYNTYDRALNWLQSNEPELRDLIGDRQPLDFQCLKHYSYSSRQVFSSARWACTGDAAVFSDPFLSPGIDQLGFANTLIVDLIKQERAGRLLPETVDYFNQVYLNFNASTSWLIQKAYPFFGNALVMGTKLLWDFVRGWALNGPQRFNRIYLDTQKAQELQPALSRLFPLTVRMEKLFKDWAEHSQKKSSYQFFDYFSASGVLELYLRNLQSNKSLEQVLADHQETIDYLDVLAQTIFLVALADTMPEMLAQLPSPLWLNAWGIGLDPKRWKADKLFAPTSPPRSLMLDIFSDFSGGVALPLTV